MGRPMKLVNVMPMKLLDLKPIKLKRRAKQIQRCEARRWKQRRQPSKRRHQMRRKKRRTTIRMLFPRDESAESNLALLVPVGWSKHMDSHLRVLYMLKLLHLFTVPSCHGLCRASFFCARVVVSHLLRGTLLYD